MADVQLTTDESLQGGTEAAPLLSDDRSRTPPSSQAKPQGYNLFIACCFFLNYSIGAGILGIPEEFQAGGYVLGLIITLKTHLTLYK